MDDGTPNRGETYELCIGAMTALAIVTDRICRAGLIDRTDLMADLVIAQDMNADARCKPLSMFQLMLELLDADDRNAVR